MTEIATTENPLRTDKHQNYKDAIESALDIVFYYEDDEYECLMEESVIEDLTSEWGYSISEAHEHLETALAIHRYRKNSGFYN